MPTAQHLVGGEPHTPTSDWELVHGAVHYAKELGQPLRVGPIVSSDLFYNPDGEQYARWSSRGNPSSDEITSEGRWSPKSST